MNTLHTHLVSLAIVGAFVVSVPAFASHPVVSPNLGTPVHNGVPGHRPRPHEAGRIIGIDANTKWINVTGGELVKFVVDGKSFSWLFDTYSTGPVFDLDKIAPAGMLDGRAIKVYVAADPLYTGG